MKQRVVLLCSLLASSLAFHNAQDDARHQALGGGPTTISPVDDVFEFTSMHHTQHRDLLFSSFFCKIGFKIPPQLSCICQEDQLRDAVENASTDVTDATQIAICSKSTIVLSNGPIDITGKAIKFVCYANLLETCAISGGGQNRIFFGAPALLDIDFLRLIDGNGKKNGKNDDMKVRLLIDKIHSEFHHS